MKLKTNKTTTSWTHRRIDWKTTTPPVASVSWNLCFMSLLQKGKVLTKILKCHFRCNVFMYVIYGSWGGLRCIRCFLLGGYFLQFSCIFWVPSQHPTLFLFFPGCGGISVRKTCHIMVCPSWCSCFRSHNCHTISVWRNLSCSVAPPCARRSKK